MEATTQRAGHPGPFSWTRLVPSAMTWAHDSCREQTSRTPGLSVHTPTGIAWRAEQHLPLTGDGSPSPRCHSRTHATRDRGLCLNCQNLPTPDPTLGDLLQQQPPPCLPTPLLLPSSGTGSRLGRRESSGHESEQTPLLPAASPRHSLLSHGPFYPLNMISGLRVLAILFPLPEMLFPTLLLDQLLLAPPTSPSCHIPKGALSWPQPKLGP